MPNIPIDSAFITDVLFALAVAATSLIAAAGVNHLFALLSRRFNLAAFRGRSLQKTVRYALLIAATLIILNRFGFGTNNILAIVGTLFGLVAIGFVAVWSVLSNFLCTLIILAFRPFRVGDRVSLPSENVGGVVREIGLTFTVLETENGALAHVPNNLFFQKIFTRGPR